MIASPNGKHGTSSRHQTPGEVLAAITGKPYLSPSQIRSFQSCSLSWFYATVERAKRETSSATMTFGTAVHAAIQRHLEALLSVQPQVPIDELLKVYREAFDKEAAMAPMQFAKGESADSLQATAKQVLLAFLEQPLARPKGIIGIEETLRIQLEEDLPDLVGRIDLLSFHDGVLTITDFKTTRTLWGQEQADASSQQLSLYARAAAPIARDLGATIRLRFILLTKHKTPRIEEIIVPADGEKVFRATLIMRRVYRAMISLSLFPNPSPMNCASCPYQQRCAEWHLSEPESNR